MKRILSICLFFMLFAMVQAQVATFKLKDPSNARKYTLVVNPSTAKLKLTFSETTAINNDIFYYDIRYDYIILSYKGNSDDVAYDIMLSEDGDASLTLPNGTPLSLKAVNSVDNQKAWKTLCRRLKHSRISKRENVGVVAGPDDDILLIDHLDIKPEYPGGVPAITKYLQENLQYPPKALKNKKEGRVLVSFVVSRTGKVCDAKVVRSVDPDCDKEALRVVSAMPNWTPGKVKGRTVNCKYTIPVRFKLAE